MRIVLALCVLKFLSWSIALGSGTSGGTLAPLLTIGGAAGALTGTLVMYLFPTAGVNLPLAALVGMSAMFAGASRALLTSIIFALQTTGQSAALLPLLASCTASFLVSFFLMENTIMTEKIARRGVKTPDSYEPDILEKVSAGEVIKENELVLNEEVSIGELRNWLGKERDYNRNYFIIVSNINEFRGIVSSSNIFSNTHNTETPVGTIVKRKDISVGVDESLRKAVEMMAKEGIDVLPVVSRENNIIGVLSYKDIISAYKKSIDNHEKKRPSISLKRNTLKILVHGQKLITAARKKD
jgi:CBS domain-containing protein